MAKLQQFFQRMITVADRTCSQCDDTVLEGDTYFKPKDASVWCPACVEYENQRE